MPSASGRGVQRYPIVDRMRAAPWRSPRLVRHDRLGGGRQELVEHVVLPPANDVYVEPGDAVVLETDARGAG